MVNTLRYKIILTGPSTKICAVFSWITIANDKYKSSHLDYKLLSRHWSRNISRWPWVAGLDFKLCLSYLYHKHYHTYIAAEFKVWQCWASLHSACTILSMVFLGAWGHSPRNIFEKLHSWDWIRKQFWWKSWSRKLMMDS